MNSFWIWLQGYVTVRFRGPGLECLLNKITDLDIVLQKVERLTGDVIIARLSIRNFRRLRPLLRGLRINVSILDKHGAPFVLARSKVRMGLAIGLIFSFLLIIYLANFIWFIEVKGCNKISKNELQAAVADLSLQAGVSRKAVQPRLIELELLKQFPDLAWVQVNVKGVRLEIYLTESEDMRSEYTGSGHIYATTDGVVTEILVLQGTAQVKDGSTVLKDDLLISGEYYDSRGKKQYGAAQGVVKGRVWYVGVGEGALVSWEPIQTGKNHHQYLITLGTVTIPLGRSYSWETHIYNEKTWHLSLGRAMVPLSFKKIKYTEVEYLKKYITQEQAEQVAYNLAWESLRKQGVESEAVLDETISVNKMMDAEGVHVTVRIEVLEDIGYFISP